VIPGLPWLRIVLAFGLLLVLWAAFQGFKSQQQEIGYTRAKAEAKVAADAQTARNREMQRAAELRYTVTSQVREKWFVATVKEIRDASAPLAACPVPDAAVRLLDAARACAIGDPAAACGAGDRVPGP
jgi:hypothetical protein